jgi:hypothetical protein
MESCVVKSKARSTLNLLSAGTVRQRREHRGAIIAKLRFPKTTLVSTKTNGIMPWQDGWEEKSSAAQP